MPSNQTPLGARPSRFRRQRVLIVGCGDVGMRVVRALPARMRVLALTSNPARTAQLRAAGITPLLGDLDRPASLARLAGLAQRVVHLAPPAADAAKAAPQDLRTQNLMRALRLRSPPVALVYGSTSGVYGDCGGAWVSEARPVLPQTARARRRVDAERQLRFFGRGAGVRVSVLRIPGIYAPDRPAGTPRERLLRGTPVLCAPDDVYTNHIHADDLARGVIAALWRGRPQRVYHACDDSVMKMGDYFDLAADLYGLPRPPRVTRSAAREQLPPMLLSFMSESRRLDNTRMKRELRLRLRYPTVQSGLHA
ncbi:SDR family oxidoreductase [Ramlibacter ginsenosidimutans]|uniref:SDR family oxidoreductase n=1 Tax=Ramlibacter ginsenosidimutans TaxID=502333 RepID=A0A934TXC0_9BURK|nr:SDR family oxidoreductase [Ramlibacter ginsenosidimutans]MBK6009026.1 SDR family oxidoreductase [Ramlibacter ginsenosidimutans]